MSTLPFADRRTRAALRMVLSHYVANGMAAALGLLLISTTVHLALGAAAASAASVGVIVCTPPDQPAPRRGKFLALLPAALLGPPLFFIVLRLHASPLELGLLLVPATFFAFLAGAWGKRGLPIAMSVMFAMIFALAVPEQRESAWRSTAHFALGSVLYLLWATLASAVLNGRLRVQMLADTLLSLAALMRIQSAQFTSAAEPPAIAGTSPLVGRLLVQQAALADQVQTARNILLESPRTPRRQQLAGMLMQVLDMRDHLLACELDLDLLKSRPGHAPVLGDLNRVLAELAEDTEALADALLLRRQPAPATDHRPQLAALHADDGNAVAEPAAGPSPSVLARGLGARVAYVNDAVATLTALARGAERPDLPVVRAAWQMFVSPTAWSWQPAATLWRWDAPPLRHAMRAARATVAAYVLALALPWGSHDYWILITIVVVLRGSLAQTLERRNSRVAGTLLGCVLTWALLAAPLSPPVLLGVVALAQAVAHAFAVRRYLVTAAAATVMGLVQAHLLGAGGDSPVFDIAERMADTLIGVAIAWAFSYVLPSWEREQVPQLVQRALVAQARHAREALALGQLAAVDDTPELAWRLARREAYDSLSALVQATQRSLFEPRAVRPPLQGLSRLLAHSYQLLAQLTAVKTMLLLRRGHLRQDRIGEALQQAGAAIVATLLAAAPKQPPDPAGPVPEPLPEPLPDPFEKDLSPWLLRRLTLARGLAAHLRNDAKALLPPPALPP